MTNLYLKNLENACKKLESVDTFENNDNIVFSFIMPIINSYNDIKINAKSEDDINNSLSLILNIKENNPNLKGVIDAIVDILTESHKCVRR